MVDPGHSAIREVLFASRLDPAIPVEVLDRDELLGRMGRGLLARPERPSFHLLLLVRGGSGRHTVDFRPVALERGVLLHVRPGQVQVWDTTSDVDASVVVSRAHDAAARPWFPGDSCAHLLDPVSLATAESLVQSLHREQVRFSGEPAERRLLTGMSHALTAVFDRHAPETADRVVPLAYTAFRSAVEEAVRRGSPAHNVRDYAPATGYSERTLTRACLRVQHLTAKRVLDDRLVLEAKRLLAHTDEPSAAVARRLGFGDPTNFHRFFVRHTGLTSTEFRASTT